MIGVLPAPLTSPDCDLRGYDYMPLLGHRLFASELYANSNDREFRAALQLLWTAWQQCPAGSLPSADIALALMADFGRNLKGWRRAKTMALRGFILCSDNRLYHPLLCAEAVKAYEMRTRFKAKRQADNDRQNSRRRKGHDVQDEAKDETHFIARRQDRTGEDKTGEEKIRQGDRPLQSPFQQTLEVQALELPEWLPVTPWNNFLATRTAKNVPTTSVTMGVILARRAVFRAEGNDITEILNQSIMSNWAGVFEVRTGATARPRRKSSTQLRAKRLGLGPLPGEES